MIAITTSGITIKASERIMSPTVACRVVRATSLSSQSTPTPNVRCSRVALEGGAVVTLRETRYWIARSARGRVSLIAPPITSGRLPTLADRNTVL
jgi:hypothetical protein